VCSPGAEVEPDITIAEMRDRLHEAGVLGWDDLDLSRPQRRDIRLVAAAGAAR
jgi:hypothetical protein